MSRYDYVTYAGCFGALVALVAFPVRFAWMIVGGFFLFTVVLTYLKLRK